MVSNHCSFGVLLLLFVVAVALFPDGSAASRIQGAHTQQTVMRVGSEQELNIPNLKKNLMYALSAFCTDTHPGLKNWTCPWCTYLPVPPVNVQLIFSGILNTTKSIYGYVGYSNESIIVSFRGSATLDNWLNNLDFFHHAYPEVPGASVHKGFYNGYQKVASQIVPVVKSLKNQFPNLPILTTGHSLGAALSLVAAVDLARLGYKDVHMWNYGEPRVGNLAFAQYAQKLVPVRYRVINHHDIVPHLPPAWTGFHHVATEVWFPTNYTTFVVCNTADGEDKHCADSIPAWQYSNQDHLNYLGFGPNGQQPPHAC